MTKELDTRVIYRSITRVLMDFFASFAQFSIFMKSASDVFAQKNFPKDILIPKLVIDTIN